MNACTSVFDLAPDELRAQLSALELPRFRADQVLHRLYREFAVAYDAMTELPVSLRARLAEALPMPVLPVLTEQRSADGSTRKVLLQLADGNTVESVLMEYDPSDTSRGRETVCISTQVGCAMGCVFCATGQQGFLRNLSAGEITQQVLHFARELRQEGRHVTNVVFMGMGEPLANYAATIKAIRILTAPDAFGLGARRITVSTVGVVPMMRRLAGEGLQVGLAVSLHTADDELRRRLIPTARFDVDEILTAADDYTASTNRRYTVEYALIDRVNDTEALAEQLALLLRGRPCHVNLIPVNPTANPETRRSIRNRVLRFERTLQERGINATVRVEKGIDIAAGCGQLRGAEEGRRPESEPLELMGAMQE
ncbi:MAG: 23S rRNA (adenine(2503)-C(2))-methyltransferase RlmN [Dehalococcoidia bacterium]